MKVFVLMKTRSYSYNRPWGVFGVVADRTTADRWKDWADGDYVEVETNDPISTETKLLFASEEPEVKERREKSILPVDRTIQFLEAPNG